MRVVLLGTMSFKLWVSTNSEWLTSEPNYWTPAGVRNRGGLLCTAQNTLLLFCGGESSPVGPAGITPVEAERQLKTALWLVATCGWNFSSMFSPIDLGWGWWAAFLLVFGWVGITKNISVVPFSLSFGSRGKLLCLFLLAYLCCSLL